MSISEAEPVSSASFDARHAFIFDKIRESFALNSVAPVENFAARGENLAVIDDFLKENGSRRLLFFYQPREKNAGNEGGGACLRGVLGGFWGVFESIFGFLRCFWVDLWGF
jgi:hypothetical protein